ncbi:hypothetical protein D9M70_447560 [compost metagenome]
MQTAPVDDRNAGFLHLGDQCGEVLVADIDTFIEGFGEAGFVHRLLGFIGKALTIGGLVVNDGDLRVLEVGGKVGTGYCALLVVTAAGAERVPHTALGELRVGRRRRDLQDAVFGIDFRCRDRHTGVEVTNDELHTVSDELVGDRDALLRVRNVVAEHKLDLFPVDTASGVDVGSGLFGTFLELRTEGGVRASQRAGDTNENISPGGAAEGDHRRQRNGRQKRFFHSCYSQIFERVSLSTCAMPTIVAPVFPSHRPRRTGTRCSLYLVFQEKGEAFS